MSLQVGQVLHNRYRIVKLIGQGGFGAVYRAWDTSLNQACAVKENLDTSTEAQRQFQREANMMASLRHPNLPRVTDHFFVPNQGQYLVMDFIEGENLEQKLNRQGGPFIEREILPWIKQICHALHYLHTRQPAIIHRDIKPQNIIITPEGTAMLVDFGISKIYDATLRTTIGAKAVTPGYSPPEQYGMGVTDARTDVYAMGATLFALLTGQEPPASVDIVAGAAFLPEPRRLNSQVSPELSQVIVQAMSLNASQRFTNVQEILDHWSSPEVARARRQAPKAVGVQIENVNPSTVAIIIIVFLFTSCCGLLTLYWLLISAGYQIDWVEVSVDSGLYLRYQHPSSWLIGTTGLFLTPQIQQESRS
jgi:eukaryotic-like serine/threonine-protein kinase